MVVLRRQAIVVSSALLAIVLGAQALCGASEENRVGRPPWEDEFVVWPRHEGQPTPWRDDSRISALSPDGYPDDFPVYFDNPDPILKDEIMWVTAIDYFAATDEYLGILLNSPNDLKSVQVKDNAVFRWDSDSKRLLARSSGDRYDASGLPFRARTAKPLSNLWQGIRQYRLGDFGHNQAAIERCISILSSATKEFGAHASAHDRYLGHFVLGRCHAEAYNTDAAIEAFQAALEYKSGDVDAHMALLAEYSLKVHTPADQAENAYDASYGPLFLEKLRYVCEHFSDDVHVAAMATIIFDESEASGLSDLTAEEIERGRKFGFAVFRWKRH